MGGVGIFFGTTHYFDVLSNSSNWYHKKYMDNSEENIYACCAYRSMWRKHYSVPYFLD